LFVTPTFPPITGGTEIATYELAKRLQALGNKVTILTPRFGNSPKCECMNGVDVHRLDTARFKPSFVFNSFIFSRFAKQLSKKRRFDVLHQFHVFPLGGACVITKYMLRLPLVTSLMGWDTYTPIKALSKVFIPFLHWVMVNSDIVTSPSKALATHSRRRNVAIIPHGVDCSLFNQNINGLETRKRLKIGDDEVLVLTVQRLHPRKGLECLLKALGIVVRENSKVKIVIVGEGPEREKLESLAGKLHITRNVTFLGSVDHTDLPKVYAACDIFVLHTLYEAFGIVLVEAMASCKPVVSTNVGGVPEIVQNGKTGLLVPPRNSNLLAKAILLLASDEILRRTMGKEGRKIVEKRYDWSVIVERYLDLYSSIV